MCCRSRILRGHLVGREKVGAGDDDNLNGVHGHGGDWSRAEIGSGGCLACGRQVRFKKKEWVLGLPCLLVALLEVESTATLREIFKRVSFWGFCCQLPRAPDAVLLSVVRSCFTPDLLFKCYEEPCLPRLVRSMLHPPQFPTRKRLPGAEFLVLPSSE